MPCWLFSNRVWATLSAPFSSRMPAPLPSGYDPDLDITAELDPERASFYQSQIGVLRWMCELGRVDILTDVSVLSSQLVLPRDGHLDAVFHMFAYLEQKHNARLIFDPTYPTIDMTVFKECDWKHFYGDVKEALHPTHRRHVARKLTCDCSATLITQGTNYVGVLGLDI